MAKAELRSCCVSSETPLRSHVSGRVKRLTGRGLDGQRAWLHALASLRGSFDSSQVLCPNAEASEVLAEANATERVDRAGPRPWENWRQRVFCAAARVSFGLHLGPCGWCPIPAIGA
ncbi:hypothetical protein KIL84_021477 [Mauremys mutica]|uniref:Uncharacterized protein n=1 Tax=Mauremys mutica TaxID=74926 RepID=A0A9D4AYB4_9SAUR|nr:hypothetical protein KIL84_021477 [Mauremys mutica]